MTSRRLARVLTTFAASLVATVGLALVAVDKATAHAYLVRSTPEAGARLERSPQTLLFYFSEPFVAASERIAARRAGGETIALPPPVRRGTVVRQPLPPRLRGVVVVNWAVLSDDGHPSQGELAFAAATGAAVPQVAGRQQQETPWGQSAASWLFFMGFALALGGLVSERWLWGGRDVARPPVGLGLLVAANGALIYLAVIASERAGGVAELTSPGDVVLGLETRPGRLTLAMLAFLGLATVAVLSRRGRLLAIPALVTAAAVSAARGHSGTSGHWWALPADALHLAAAAVWIGALVHLVRVVYAAPAEDRRETLGHGVRRYASLALVTVLVAIAAGLVTALAQFDGLDELIETGYGQMLLAKGALIGVALAVALAARTRALGVPWPEWGLLGRAGTFELASGAVVLLLLALLVGSSPVQLVSSVLFAATLVVCAVAVRHALLASEGGVAALVVAGASGVLAINAGIVATGAAFFRPGSAGGEVIIGTRVALAAAAGGLAVGAVARALSRGGALRLPLLRRLTAAEAAALVGALAAAALLVNLAPPRAAEALAGRADIGPPPITGPAVRLGEFTGQLAVGVTAAERLLRFEVVVPSAEPVEGLRLTAEAEPPRGLSADLYPRRCGNGCFTIRYRLPPGRTTVTAEVVAPGFEGGRVRFVIPWPPPRERAGVLRRVARTMYAVRELEMTELVVSGRTSARSPATYRLPGKELLEKAEAYRGGAVDVRVVDRARGLTQLAFALPASNIWYRMWIDERHRVRRELIVNRGHRITRSFRYPGS